MSFAALKTGINTLIIFVADHGPQFARGKMTCYQGGLQIPLIVKPPGAAARQLVSEELVSQVDIFPTIADYCGLSESAGGSGHSLRRFIEGSEARGRDYLVAEWNASIRTYPTDYFPQRCIRNPRFKLIRTLTDRRPSPSATAYREALDPKGPFGGWPGVPTPVELAASSRLIQEAYKIWLNPPPEELYDLQTDPDELINLAANPEYNSIRKDLGAALINGNRRPVIKFEIWRRSSRRDQFSNPDLRWGGWLKIGSGRCLGRPEAQSLAASATS